MFEKYKYKFKKMFAKCVISFYNRTISIIIIHKKIQEIRKDVKRV